MSVTRALTWATKDIDLWMGLLIPKPQYNWSAKKDKVPGKPISCWACNENFCRFRDHCKYKHECSICTGQQPAFRCIKRFMPTAGKGANKEHSRKRRQHQAAADDVTEGVGPSSAPSLSLAGATVSAHAVLQISSYRLGGDCVQLQSQICCDTKDITLQTAGTASRLYSSSMPDSLVGSNISTILTLIYNSVAEKTWRTYRKSWAVWQVFLKRHKKVKELDIIILFILNCMESQMAVASIKKHIAGISFFNRLLGKIDYSKAQIVKQILKGMQRKEGKTDTRKPITMVMMVKLIEVLEKISEYEKLMFKMLFIICFFGAFRISEVVSPSKKAAGGLEMTDVQLTERKVKITIRKSKTDVSSKKQIQKVGRWKSYRYKAYIRPSLIDV
ncbi:hypothetical protein XELAEV_18031250mg [Xenopus laevis]|uniref:C3H1-type domain-containing protein n=1 Tax=Xenopus laevis TaxID=8355 RepID=A0A974CNF5_XENLA|nr:hypothetical protein XELAEV_18031250mg [Xenopus laevis]